MCRHVDEAALPGDDLHEPLSVRADEVGAFGCDPEADTQRRQRLVDDVDRARDHDHVAGQGGIDIRGDVETRVTGYDEEGALAAVCDEIGHRRALRDTGGVEDREGSCREHEVLLTLGFEQELERPLDCIAPVAERTEPCALRQFRELLC